MRTLSVGIDSTAHVLLLASTSFRVGTFFLGCWTTNLSQSINHNQPTNSIVCHFQHGLLFVFIFLALLEILLGSLPSYAYILSNQLIPNNNNKKHHED